MKFKLEALLTPEALRERKLETVYGEGKRTRKSNTATCPHCGARGIGAVFNRQHFGNCEHA